MASRACDVRKTLPLRPRSKESISTSGSCSSVKVSPSQPPPHSKRVCKPFILNVRPAHPVDFLPSQTISEGISAAGFAEVVVPRRIRCERLKWTQSGSHVGDDGDAGDDADDDGGCAVEDDEEADYDDFEEAESDRLVKAKHEKKRGGVSISAHIKEGTISCVSGREITSDGLSFEDNMFDPIPNLKFHVAWTNWCSDLFFRSLKSYQKCNHIPCIELLTRKKELGTSLTKMRSKSPQHYNFFPQTWLLPQEARVFVAHFQAQQRSDEQHTNAYIVKPNASSEGKGIYLALSPDEMDLSQPMVIQQYLSNPYLIEGRKFDLRVYVLITSVEPLRIYVYKEGLARFCAEPYSSLSSSNKQNLFMHLTNYAINSKHENFVFNSDEKEKNVGNKWALSALLSFISSNHGDEAASGLWKSICEVVVKSIISIQPTLKHMYKIRCPTDKDGGMCFQFLGYDILVDRNLKPWLLEINRNPSLKCETPLDTAIKVGLIRDILELVNPLAYRVVRLKSKGSIRTQRTTFSDWKQRHAASTCKTAACMKRVKHEESVLGEKCVNQFQIAFPPFRFCDLNSRQTKMCQQLESNPQSKIAFEAQTDDQLDQYRVFLLLLQTAAAGVSNSLSSSSRTPTLSKPTKPI